VDRLARHLDAFGEIKITKLEPEHTVAWEGEGASGTVSIEPSGWGTKVTLTAQLEAKADGGGDAAAVEEPPLPDEASEETVEAAEETAVVAERTAADETTAAQETAVVAERTTADEARAVGETIGEPADTRKAAVADFPVGENATEAAGAGTAAMTEWVGEESEPEPVEESVDAKQRRRRGLLGWLFRQRTSERAGTAPAPEPVATEPEPVGTTAPEPDRDVTTAPELETATATEPEMDGGEPEPAMDGGQPEPEPDGGQPEPDGGQPEPDGGQPEPDGGQPEPEPRVATEPQPNDPPAIERAPDSTAPAERSSGTAGVEAPEEADGQASLDPEHAQAVLDEVLDTLGAAHHRPFSRG
jgi:hypothetical protein